MSFIKLVSNADEQREGPDQEVNVLFNGSGRQLVEVRLRNQATLAKHTAAFPITVFCVKGSGVFNAGPNLEDTQELQAGTLLTLEANVEHEVVADPELHLIVSKFKGEEAVSKISH